jgi:NAD(P)-dependent dehydrogenase (short-subunit alcohol dehydrogenase family)
MSQRIALVTGGNRGIGLEVCRQLGRLGHRVLLGSRSKAAASKVVAECRKAGLDVTAVTLDVTRPDDIQAVRSFADEHFGGLDIPVNNAAILLSEKTGILDVTRDELVATFETNFFAQAAMCQAFVPGMMARRYGRVVNVSSQAGQLTDMGTYAPAYSMSKTALNALTRILAETTRRSGVLVNCVNPGWVRTDMGGAHAPRSVEQGADTIVWAATLPAHGPTGAFLSDRKRIDW